MRVLNSNYTAITLFAIAAALVCYTAFDIHDHPWSQTPPRYQQVPTPKPNLLPPTVQREVRDKAWTQVRSRLNASDADWAANRDQLIERHLAPVDEFFAQRREGTRPFAEKILSLGGSWKLLKAQLGDEWRDEHLRFLRDQFDGHVFKTGDLHELIERTVRAYAVELEGIENRLLVQARLDVRDSDLRAAAILPAVETPAQFEREYREMVERVLPTLNRDLRTGIGREVASWVAGDLAGKVAIRLATAVGMKLGILSAGTLAGPWSLGISIVAAILVDVALDQILKLAGHDPAAAVAERVDAVLAGFRDTIKDGHPEAKQLYGEMRRLQNADPESDVRAECRRAADAIERSGILGLRREFLRLAEQRAALRRAAFRSLIEGEVHQ